MSIENLVVFKGSTEGIIVLLDEKAPFQQVLSNFEEKLKNSRKFFAGVKTSVKFKGRLLRKEEQEQLIKSLQCQNVIDIIFVHEFEETEEIKKREEAERLLNQLARQNNSLTYFHYGILRSGQEINYNGSVVVLGDVNPGAVITADDNIIILGQLKGKAHAGLMPRVKAPFVLAFGMYPVQVGIREVVAQSPEGEILGTKRACTPQIAYISDGQIYVEEIDFKTLNHMIE